jgi:LPPG:FO 2-phospho-L-lactate transferase
MSGDLDVAVLAGGVGAARFLRGLTMAVAPERVAAIVNTGDDTELHGLAISPDLDTITYTLAGAIDVERGWGLAGESWNAMEALGRFAEVKPAGSAAGGTWFNLGDRDLATHLYRTGRLAEGASLTEVTAEIARAWGIECALLPMSDGRLRTMLTLAATAEVVPFQEYFVRLRHEVAISAVNFESTFGGRRSELSELARQALESAATIVIAPSNPLVSIGPIRALDGVDDLLVRRRHRVVAISPIVGGAALKGPADRMLTELGFEASVTGVARVYADVASVLVIDAVDAHLAPAVEALGMRCVVTQTVMSTPALSRALAMTCLATMG